MKKTARISIELPMSNTISEGVITNGEIMKRSKMGALLIEGDHKENGSRVNMGGPGHD